MNVEYKIEFTKQAAKALQKMPREIVKTVWRELGNIASNPFAHHPKATRLQNRDGYRLRIGSWRVIYIIQEEKVVILVLKIASRGEVYR